MNIYDEKVDKNEALAPFYDEKVDTNDVHTVEAMKPMVL